MPYSIIRPVFLILLVMLGACRPAEVAEEPEEAVSNEALRQLYEADQQDRQIDFSRLSEEELRAIDQRDAEHRAQVEAMLEAGDVRTAEDYYHAAMVFQHGGDSTAYRKAYEAARQAVALDSLHASAAWMSAASWDRYQLSLGKLQWYGTQYIEQDNLWQLQPIDTTRVTDQDRQRLGVFPLQQTRAILHCTNTEENMTLGDCMLRQLEQNQTGSDR